MISITSPNRRSWPTAFERAGNCLATGETFAEAALEGFVGRAAFFCRLIRSLLAQRSSLLRGLLLRRNVLARSGAIPADPCCVANTTSSDEAIELADREHVAGLRTRAIRRQLAAHHR